MACSEFFTYAPFFTLCNFTTCLFLYTANLDHPRTESQRTGAAGRIWRSEIQGSQARSETEKAEAGPQSQPSKRQHTAYTLFVQEVYPGVRAQYQDFQSKDIIGLVARQWASIPEVEKQVWKERAMASHEQLDVDEDDDEDDDDEDDEDEVAHDERRG
jgi:hypothetical protein